MSADKTRKISNAGGYPFGASRRTIKFNQKIDAKRRSFKDTPCEEWSQFVHALFVHCQLTPDTQFAMVDIKRKNGKKELST